MERVWTLPEVTHKVLRGNNLGTLCFSKYHNEELLFGAENLKHFACWSVGQIQADICAHAMSSC